MTTDPDFGNTDAIYDVKFANSKLTLSFYLTPENNNQLHHIDVNLRIDTQFVDKVGGLCNRYPSSGPLDNQILYGSNGVQFQKEESAAFVNTWTVPDSDNILDGKVINSDPKIKTVPVKCSIPPPVDSKFCSSTATTTTKTATTVITTGECANPTTTTPQACVTKPVYMYVDVDCVDELTSVAPILVSTTTTAQSTKRY